MSEIPTGPQTPILVEWTVRPGLEEVDAVERAIGNGAKALVQE